MSHEWRREDGDALILTLHVQPGAKQTAVAGAHGEALKIRIKASPIENRANAELLRFLADAFDVSVRDVTLLRGATTRQKVVRVAQPKRRPDLDWE